MTQHTELDHGDVAVEEFFDAGQEMLSGAAVNLQLEWASATTVKVPAGEGHDQVSLSIQGRYRWVDEDVSVGHPGGSAGTYSVWAVSDDNELVDGLNVNQGFALAVTSGDAPSAEISRKVGEYDWDGSAITAVRRTADAVVGAAIDDAAIEGSGRVSVTRQADGALLLDIPDGGVTQAKLANGAIDNAKVASNAQIAESKLNLASDAAAGTASRRTLGTGAQQAAAGNDSRFPAGADIVAGDIADGAITLDKLASAVQGLLVPAGTIAATGRSSAPSGWLLCQGQAVSRSTYADLFAAIGTAYGSGNGSTTFNVPDLKGRVPVGKGAHADVDTLGEGDGLADASRTPHPSHLHAISLTSGTGGSHSHTLPSQNTTTDITASGTTSGKYEAVVSDQYVDHYHRADGWVTDAVGGHQHAVSGNTGSTASGPAFQVVNYMIKV